MIHLEPSELLAAFRELRRVLEPQGVLLLGFHAGDQTLHLDELWGLTVSLDFHFLAPQDVIASLLSASLATKETVEREPYDGAEYPSQRCYVLARPI